MAAGRKPIPTHLQLVKGVSRRDRLPVAEPKPDVGMPEAPVLSGKVARAAWRRFGTLLLGMGVLTKADGAALERLCECYAEVEELSRRIINHGSPVYEAAMELGSDGKPVPGTGTWKVHPEWALRADADRRLKSYLVEFGLTPATRGKVGAAPAGKADPVDGYFGERA